MVSTELRGWSGQAFAALHMHAKDAHRGGNNRGASDQANQAENFQAPNHADEKQEIVQPRAIAEQHGAYDIVRDRGDSGTNRDNQEGFAPMPCEE